MSNLIACQPGWVAVFRQDKHEEYSSGYSMEPIACWLLVDAPHQPAEIHPVCALGGDVCDATIADNYLGVIPPYLDSTKTRNAALALIDAWRASQPSRPSAA